MTCPTGLHLVLPGDPAELAERTRAECADVCTDPLPPGQPTTVEPARPAAPARNGARPADPYAGIPPLGEQHEAPVSATEDQQQHPPETLPPPSDPMAVARVLVADYQIDGCLTVRWWRGAWMQWRETRWAEVEDTVIRSAIYTRLEHAKYWQWRAGTADKAGDWERVPWLPTRYKIANVLDALTAITHLPEDVDPPTWLNRDEPHEPRPGGYRVGEIVACTNGLLDVSTRELHPLTPHYFNRAAVPFAYDPRAPTPVRWLRFLADLWPDDAASIAALQEFFGYVLSGRTDLHKILLVIGPTRSGKGTLARVLAELLGAGNVAGPTLASLGTNFGLSSLLNKPLAVVSDARLSGANVHQVVERLLSVSGEDTLTVDRKYREPWTGTLPARFLLLSNELPHFGDVSGAIAHRFVVLAMHHSFLGHENTRLTGELLAELPGILAWSLQGLDRLTGKNTFTEPASSVDAITALQDLVSPVAAFVRDRCTTTDAAAGISVSELFTAWKTWCDDNGHKAGSTQTFGRDLRAVVPQLRVFRPHAQERRYIGIALPRTDHNGPCRGSRGSDGKPTPDKPDPEPVNRAEPRHTPLWSPHEQDDDSAPCPRCQQPAERLLTYPNGEQLGPCCAYPAGQAPDDDQETNG